MAVKTKALPPGKTAKNSGDGGGRPTKYTEEVRKILIGRLDEGQRFYVACTLAGVSTDTVNDWVKRGARGEEPFVGLAQDISKAKATAEARLVQSVVRAAHEDKDWRAGRFLLQVRKPKEYTERKRLELTGPDGEPIETKNENRAGLTKETAEFIRKEILGVEDEDR